MIKLINGDSLDLFYKITNKYNDKNIVIVSDPPFNINYKYNTYNDNMNDDEYFKMLYNLFSDFPSVVIHYPEQLYRLSLVLKKSSKKDNKLGI